VWPETVLRSYLRHRGEYRDRVTGLAREIGRPLLVGALDLSPEGAREMNAAYLVQPVAWSPTAAEGELDVYHKRHLLPFGERLPAWGAALGLRHWRTTGRFVAGTGGRLRFTIEPDDGFLEQRSVAMAPAICFEATRAGAFNAAVRSGAGFLVNLSDDSWFANSHGPDQHLQAVVLRAVETRRWLVRASNSGISAFIDPTGQVVRSLPLGATGLLRHRIAIEREMTPYVRWGDWFLVPCLLTVFAAVGGRSVCARWRHWRGSSMHARPRQGTGCVLRSKSACGIEDGGVIDEQRTA
jgi:apolipoprotein N-acyltransferase